MEDFLKLGRVYSLAESRGRASPMRNGAHGSTSSCTAPSSLRDGAHADPEELHEAGLAAAAISLGFQAPQRNKRAQISDRDPELVSAIFGNIYLFL